MGETGEGRGPAGTIIRASGKDGPQVIRSRGHRWTDEAETIFLDHLAASCNVKLSADASGFSTVAIYNRRRSDRVSPSAGRRRWSRAMPGSRWRWSSPRPMRWRA